MSFSVPEGTALRLEQEVHFDQHRLGADLGLDGLNGGVPFGEIKIRRGSDGKFWNGAAFDTPEQYVATTIGGGTTDPISYYDWTLPISAADGEVFTIWMRANSDPATEIIKLASKTVTVTGGGGVVFVID